MGTNGLVLLAGTKKGLFVLTSSDRKAWRVSEPMLKGKEVNHAIFDHRTGKLFATSNDAWFGSEIVWSADMGQTWQSATRSPAFAEASGQKLDRLWHIRPGGDSEPNTLYTGVAPAALFRSTDSGQTWDEVRTLSEHSTRKEWQPGAGGLCLHSIVLNPANSAQLYVGISAVGVFRSDDAGATWRTANKGTRAEFMPIKYPEYGQCVHKLLLAPDSKTLFQQNHCGVYRSDDGGTTWEEITAGLTSDFGFPLAIHPRDPKTIYVFPLQGGEFRCPPNGKMQIFRSRDGGKNWQGMTDGLPQANAFFGAYREGMCVDPFDPAGVYLGTNTGQIYASANEGDSWEMIEGTLPPIFSLETAVIK